MSPKATCLLPDAVIPNHYDVKITPDLETFTFKGVVSINISILEPIREIKLHAADLEISAAEVKLWPAADEPVVPLEVRLDDTEETATFVFPAKLPVADAVLVIKYAGTINDKMAGFYRSRYIGANGETCYLGTTQLEATDARRALPCWDEPARKATFDVSLVVPKKMTTLSNMPIRATVIQPDGTKTVRFDRSPLMSSYLLAFVVGELEYIETRTTNGTLVRVYTVPGKSAHGAFALDTAKRTLEFYNEYFDIPYPLPKLDMIAIPDFAAGAMENWGLVTYRENAVLIDPVNSSAGAYQRVAEVVTHELAHQWFGNLVTMKWWTHLWLNEGFATWMASFAMDRLFPKWDIWTQFVANKYASALSLDGLRSTHPIEVEVGHPDEISQIFDAISYCKGASIIRMIHDYIGADAFRAGMQTYLKRHAYGNATTEDLWQALGETSGQPVQSIMDTWTKQGGYPLVTLKQKEQAMFEIEQQRFLASGNDLTEKERAQKWNIPLAYCINAGGLSLNGKLLCETHSRSKLFRCLKLNLGQIALARVNYPADQWRTLTKAVRYGVISPTDRYGIVSDALSLSRAGHLSTSQLLELLPAYADEDNYSVWVAVLGALGAIAGIIDGTPEEARFALFARSILRPIGEKLGWDAAPDEPHTTRLLRGMTLAALGYYGDEETAFTATARFVDHAAGLRSIDPDLRAAVYDIAAKYGDEDTLAALIALYEREPFQEEKVRLLGAMGEFTNPAILSAVLDYAINSGKVRAGDFIYTLRAFGSHTEGRRSAWQFLQNHWDMLNERYACGGLKMLGGVIGPICNGFARTADADAVEAFFKTHPAPSATRAIAEAVECIRLRAAWYERDKAHIAAALSSTGIAS